MPQQHEIVAEHTTTLREHDRSLATLIERVDGIRADIGRIEASIKELSSRAQDLATRLELAVANSERLESRLEEIRLRRWDVLKIAIGAIITLLIGLVTLTASGLWNRALERSAPMRTIPVAPVGREADRPAPASHP